MTSSPGSPSIPALSSQPAARQEGTIGPASPKTDEIPVRLRGSRAQKKRELFCDIPASIGAPKRLAPGFQKYLFIVGTEG